MICAALRKRGLQFFLIGTVLSALMMFWWALYYLPFAGGYKFPRDSERIIVNFANTAAPAHQDYIELAKYFTEGFVTYSSPLATRASMPGYPSENSRAVQEMEAFSRLAPLFAVLMKSTQSDVIVLPSRGRFNIAEMFLYGIEAGVNPKSPEYWGNIGDQDQRIVEAADIALALWISRERVWHRFSRDQKDRIVKWLGSVNGRRVADNNWHLFIAQVNVVLKALGEPFSQDEIDSRLSRVRSFYRGGGWFSDGLDGEFDYYNAWGFHYHLGWIHKIDSSLVDDLIGDSLPVFSTQLLHLIGPRGFPVLGRSVCYRIAVSAPLVMGAGFDTELVDASKARRALDLTWRYFLKNGAVKQGRISQGYCGDDPRILDSYSGPASCLWSLRSLIVALDIPESSRFWTGQVALLPIEVADFHLPLGSTGLVAKGSKASGDIVIVSRSDIPVEEASVQPYSLMARVKDLVTGGVRRPDNEKSKYFRPSYSSIDPFCGCQLQ